MEVYDLENLIGGKERISSKCVEHMKKAGIKTIYDILDMIEDGTYNTKLLDIKYVNRNMVERIAEKAIDLDLPNRNDTENEKDILDITVSNPEATEEIKEETKIKKEVVVIEEKEKLTKFDLADLLNKYIIAMLQDPKIPKLKLDFSHMYPIDSILFGEHEVYIKGDFIWDLFNKFVVTHFNFVNKNTVKDPFKYALVGSNLVQTRQIAGNKYNLNRYESVTGNSDNYILILRRDLNDLLGVKLYIEVSYDPFMELEYNPDIKVNSSICKAEEEAELVYSTSAEKQKLIENKTSNNNEIVIINSCKPVFGMKYLCTFSVIIRSGSKYNFDTKVIIGTYQFDDKEVDKGEILINGYNDPEKLKAKVLKLL